MSRYNPYDVHEIGFDHDGYHYLVLYGSHINGGFIAIPNWQICVEASSCDLWNDCADNAARLYEVRNGRQHVLPIAACRAISSAVCEDYQKYMQSLDTGGQGIWQHFGPEGRYVREGKVRIAYQKADGMEGRYFVFFENEKVQVLICDFKDLENALMQKWQEYEAQNGGEQGVENPGATI